VKELSFRMRREFPGKVVGAEGILRFAPGACVHACMGDSGAGKTTFARWLAGLDPAARGELRWGDEILENGSLRRRAGERGIALLAQGDALFPHLSVAQNVGFGLRRWPREERRERVAELLRLTGLENAQARWPSTLSGGEKRRAALAQALAPRPRLLILDEPFTGLDETAKGALGRELKNWITAAGLPTILITHDPREADALGDRA
jgi:iron(III) transport system ATP-binding protein